MPVTAFAPGVGRIRTTINEDEATEVHVSSGVETPTGSMSGKLYWPSQICGCHGDEKVHFMRSEALVVFRKSLRLRVRHVCKRALLDSTRFFVVIKNQLQYDAADHVFVCNGERGGSLKGDLKVAVDHRDDTDLLRQKNFSSSIIGLGASCGLGGIF